MCQLCEGFGLDQPSEDGAEHRKFATRNPDGTYTLILTEKQLTNLTIRLAMGVLAGQAMRS